MVERKAWISGTALNLRSSFCTIFSKTDNSEPSSPIFVLQVGFFPSECVELINEKMPQSVSAPVSKQGITHSPHYIGIKRALAVERSVMRFATGFSTPKAETNTYLNQKRSDI